MRILLVEDDEILTDLLVKSLTGQRYAVDSIDDGRMGLEYAQSSDYDLVIIDVGLPRLDGITLCQQLRTEGYSTPILLITAKEASTERIRGLDAGADDYLVKPLNLEELNARVRALLRRGDVSPTVLLEVGPLQLNPVSCEVSYAGKPLSLTPKEYSLLELMMRNPSRVFSRGAIVEHLWSFDDPPLEDSVKAHIKGLRRKLKQAGAVDWIENVYGLGYRFVPKLEVASHTHSTRTEPASLHSDSNSGKATPEQATGHGTEKAFNQAMADLWTQYEGLMIERMNALHAASEAIATHTLTPDLREHGTRAAHKLAGVLGMFNRDEGTQLARKLEACLESGNTKQLQTVPARVQQLSALLNLSTPSTAPHTKEPERSRSTLSTPPISTGAIAPTAASVPIRVLAVDDDPIILSALEQLLPPWNMQVETLNDPQHFWEVLNDTSPDVLILDVEMPHTSGIELCQAVRADHRWRDLPILFLTAHRETQTVQRVFQVGCDDYVTKPIVGPELLTRIINRMERNRLLTTLARKDAQTGLSNQRQSSQALQRALQAALREHTPLSVALLRLYTLQHIHITHGHDTGYRVLQRWGQLIQAMLHDGELAGYWGSGEFVIGLRGLSRQGASDRLAQLLKTLRQQVFTAPHGDRFQAPFHVAIAEYPTDGHTLHSLYQAAHATLGRSPQ